MRSKVNQSGMTLIEIMVALLIGAFLLGGIMQIFISSKQTYRMQENLSRLQENGRFAMEFLAKDFRMAGYWDCLAPSVTNSDVTSPKLTPHYIDIEGTEGGSAATPDSVTLRGAFSRSRASSDICGTPVTAAATVACPQTTAPANFYTDNSSIITYSIFTDANSNKFLRRTTNCTNSDIVEGIENMQISYGVDTDVATAADFGTPNYYTAANSAWTSAQWAQVVSIRIALTVRTLDGNLTKTGDGRIRRVFNTTVAVRNRMQ